MKKLSNDTYECSYINFNVSIGNKIDMQNLFYKLFAN